MKFIVEALDTEVKLLTEETKDGNKNSFIEGIFMQSEVENRNKRIYPKPVLESAVNKYVKDFVDTNRAFGELEHPSSPKINPDRVSHRITELNFKENDVIGKALILNTPCGQTVKGLMESGGQIGVSSRGVGTVAKKSGKTIVNEDFMVNTVDVVLDPSAPAAFVNGIMEGVEYFFEGNELVAKISEKAKKKIKKLSLRQIEEQQIKIFADFLQQIK